MPLKLNIGTSRTVNDDNDGSSGVSIHLEVYLESTFTTDPAKLKEQSGTVTNSSVVGRGLFRAIRHMVDGEYREAGVETLAAVAAPALMSYASTASLVLEVVDGAYELANSALEEGEVSRFRGRNAA